jgi:hypothetical protein
MRAKHIHAYTNTSIHIIIHIIVSSIIIKVSFQQNISSEIIFLSKYALLFVIITLDLPLSEFRDLPLSVFTMIGSEHK